MGILAKLHNHLRAWLLHHYRTRAVLNTFKAAHSQELRITPLQSWPLVQARQAQELAAIKAGKLDLAVVDRKSWAFPFLPATVQRLSVPLMKSTPYNLRRMSRTPVPRRAINLIKFAVISQPWEIRAIKGESQHGEDDQEDRKKVADKLLRHPNNQDSFQSFLEQCIEDMLVFGALAAEMRYTPDPARPVKIWPVNVESIRLFISWAESLKDMPRYAQMTGLKGERGAILFYDDELMYIRDNPSTDNPFGLGKMEVAFQSVNYLLGVHDMAGRSGSDQVHKTWLWWEQPQSEAAYQIVRRHIQNELEGQAKISIIGGMKKPEVIEVQPTLTQDLLLEWQEMLIRMIANAFDMSPLALGIERDVNRSTGEVLDDKDFRSAVVPMCMRIQEGLTRKLLHEKLHWYDLEFVFLNLQDPSKDVMMDILARMYSANAVTPNQIRSKMGEEPLDSPFADLTQFESMMINAEMMMKLQEMAQQKMSSMMPGGGGGPDGLVPPQGPSDMGYPGQPAGMIPAGPGNIPPALPGAPGPGSGSKQSGQPSVPLAVNKLPKFPISGSKYNARQIAMMPVNHLSELITVGELPPAPTLLRDMEQQEPGILEVMTDEVRTFFEQEVQQQELADEVLDKDAYREQHKEKQNKRMREERGRINDYAEWMKKKGQVAGRPGGGSSPQSTAGTPGHPESPLEQQRAKLKMKRP